MMPAAIQADVLMTAGECAPFLVVQTTHLEIDTAYRPMFGMMAHPGLPKGIAGVSFPHFQQDGEFQVKALCRMLIFSAT
jgi:hypothetical protein